jgi:crotonobetainyl-CoA:carnitine CoA-transferase CaiB-like acyl-CoA transferase
MEAMAGIAGLIGYRNGAPLGSGSSYLDPMGALHGAAAGLTALYARLASGGGCYIEIAQSEAAMQWIGEILLEAIDSGMAPVRQGNAIDAAAPHDAFPAVGEDEWIAIAVFDDEQWQALCRVLERGELATDPRFATHALRIAHREEIGPMIAAATRAWGKCELAARLQEAGVPAAPVLNGRDLSRDPQLRARGWFTRLTHAEAGTHDYAGLPLVHGGRRYHSRRASPMFGEHTVDVLVRYAGLTATDVEALTAAGITSAAPTGAEE